MKKLLFASAFALLGSVAVMAQDTTSVSPQAPPASTEAQDQGQAITASELPAPIQTALQGQDYSGWTVASATKKEKEGKTIYAVELKNGAETKKVKFDAEGAMIKEKE